MGNGYALLLLSNVSTKANSQHTPLERLKLPSM